MAIQLPNPGLGDGQTGDNEFVMWTKVKNNFSNTSHAASRLVGDADGNIPEVSRGGRGLSGSGIGGNNPVLINHDDTTVRTGVYRTTSVSENIHPSKPFTSWSTVFRCWQYGSVFTDISFTSGNNNPRIAMQNVLLSDGSTVARTDWVEFYTTGNTTKEAGTGYLVASSPVLKVQHDNFEKVHESEQLDIDVQHLETGVYAITGTTGLRENDGWNLKPPKDVNGNVLCICEASQDGDVITLKTYKKKFDFETVSIVADYEQPTDIPDGAEVMLRFNDLPDEPMPQEV